MVGSMVAFRTAIFSILVPGVVGGLIPWWLAQGARETVAPLTSVWAAGWILVTLGAGLYLWCAGAFTFIGNGTPAPIDAPKTLVAQGPYRWVRNPMYIGVLAVILGQAILFRSWLLVGYALLFWLVVHTFVVLVEEPSLRSQFGASYDAYVRRVSRWIPRPPKA
jgi:protein-S-isoprenylcysteine O-methyltransferase Ste14